MTFPPLQTKNHRKGDEQKPTFQPSLCLKKTHTLVSLHKFGFDSTLNCTPQPNLQPTNLQLPTHHFTETMGQSMTFCSGILELGDIVAASWISHFFGEEWRPRPSWMVVGGGVSHIFGSIFSPKIGEMIYFDKYSTVHIFQMGWFNHQLVTCWETCLNKEGGPCCWNIKSDGTCSLPETLRHLPKALGLKFSVDTRRWLPFFDLISWCNFLRWFFFRFYDEFPSLRVGSFIKLYLK